jgi:hypothetical protein
MTFVTAPAEVFWGVRETSADVNLLGAARSAEVADNSAEAKQFYTSTPNFGRSSPTPAQSFCATPTSPWRAKE